MSSDCHGVPGINARRSKRCVVLSVSIVMIYHHLSARPKRTETGCSPPMSCTLPRLQPQWAVSEGPQ